MYPASLSSCDQPCFFWLVEAGKSPPPPQMQSWRVQGRPPLSIMATNRSKLQDQRPDQNVIAQEILKGSNRGNCHAKASGHDGEPCQTDRCDDIALPCIKERLTPRNLCLTFPSHQIQSSNNSIPFFSTVERNQAETALRGNSRQAESLKVSALQAFIIQLPIRDQSGNSKHG